jgi:TRAP-type C4-dicarboxylate transport system permease small subunit
MLEKMELSTETSQVVIILGFIGLILKYSFNYLMIKADSVIQRTTHKLKQAWYYGYDIW